VTTKHQKTDNKNTFIFHIKSIEMVGITIINVKIGVAVLIVKNFRRIGKAMQNKK